MAIPVVSGATICCSMGLAPGTLSAAGSVTMSGSPCLTIADTVPITNIGPCGMCTSIANPAVASATAAALGVLTPMPCVPAPMGAWICGAAPFIGGKPGLTNDGTLVCAYGGSISLLNPGQSKVLY